MRSRRASASKIQMGPANLTTEQESIMSLRHSSPLPRLVKSRQLPGTVALALLVLFAGTAAAQEYTEFRRLGTSNAVSKPGPQAREDLQRIFRDNRAEYEKVLADTNWPGNPADLFQAITDGKFTEAQYPVGHTFEWMAVRKRGVVQATGRLRWAGRDPFEAFEIRFESNGKEHRFLIPKACGNLALIDMRDAGPPPLTAVPTLNVQSPNKCTGANVTVDITVPGGMPEGGKLELTLTRPSGQRETIQASRAGGGQRWEGKLDDAGAYTFSATLTRGSERTRTVTERLNLEPCQPTCNLSLTPPPLDPTPKAGKASLGIDMCSSAARVGSLTSKTAKLYHTPLDGPEQLMDTLSLDAECSTSYLMPEYGQYRLEGEVVDDRGMSATCQADYNLLKPESRISPFFTLFGGAERRWRPGIEAETRAAFASTGGVFDLEEGDDTFIHDRSAALFGGTFGVAYPIADGGAQVFGQGGVAINLRDSDNTSVLADVGIDKLFEGGFIGGGVGIWDINHSDTRDGTIFVHGGFNLSEKMELNIEGRLFMDMLDMIDNNYVYLLGIRYYFNR